MNLDTKTLQSPCACCDEQMPPHCRKSCGDLKAFIAVLDNENDIRFGVVDTEDDYALLFD